ncbi:unnamed protein product (macronuclear) [Paramecium tetraurelia]|uniref:Uncharacterized protein n=1 Tax=Paramecium tetraurelia TaxID=5888 RepID=A0DMZ7_PARTE|nr:uncharacterized protein GSPATT00018619001 [Paramecium tetraurelia]CAK84414.1 unnamed protein product [Paramecium tetraurelia]|eukprot:XP_001451811.1 hypothetical protein (macronuclear) [Paramecium tetraurelia strain d4-2]
MLSSLPVLSVWFALRYKRRHFKNDRIEMLILLLVGNALRTVCSTHIRLLYIIPIQNHHHPKKMFLCLPFVAIVVSVKLEFSYEHTLVGYTFLLLVWLSTHHQVGKVHQVQKNHSYSKTWINPSDSVIVNQNDKFDLVVNRQGKMISQTSAQRKLLGTDDPILIQQILQEIIIHKLDKQFKKCKIATLFQLIETTDLIKCKVLDCSTPFGDNFMIELTIIHDNVGLNFLDLFELKDYWERKVTKQLMNQLFRSFSHEFSTSLNCIRILAENAIEDIDDDYIVNTCIQPVLNSCYILNSIVQDVRDFSLILSKNFVLTIQTQNIYLLIHEVAELYRQQLNMKGVELNVKMNEFQIHTDGQRFKQVLNNLLSNAQKFTFSGSVTIDVQQQTIHEQEFIKVSVQDTGSGMDYNTQNRLQEFLKQPHKRKSNLNYGLGLMISNTICKGLSPNYESGIHFQSNHKTGSTFWFFLQDLKTLDIPEVVSRRTIKYNKMVSQGKSILEQSFLISPIDNKKQSSFTFSLQGKQKLIDKQSENFSEPDDAICAPYVFREGPKKPKKHRYPQIDQVVSEYAEERAKILIVDDEFVNIYALTTMLTRLNIKCDSAHNGKEGLEKFKQYQYQVILMDIEMPIMNGIQATQQIIEFCHQVDLDPPIIIAQTAYTDMQTKQTCKEVGMDYFLQKPISTNEIKQILQTIQLTL